MSRDVVVDVQNSFFSGEQRILIVSHEIIQQVHIDLYVNIVVVADIAVVLSAETSTTTSSMRTEKECVDLSIFEIIQLQSFADSSVAGRKTLQKEKDVVVDVSDSAELAVFRHEHRAGFYSKHVAEPLAVESLLDEDLAESLKSEITSGQGCCCRVADVDAIVLSSPETPQLLRPADASLPSKRQDKPKNNYNKLIYYLFSV